MCVCVFVCVVYVHAGVHTCVYLEIRGQLVAMLGDKHLDLMSHLICLEFFLWSKPGFLQSFYSVLPLLPLSSPQEVLAGSLLPEGHALLFHTHKFRTSEGYEEQGSEGI